MKIFIKAILTVPVFWICSILHGQDSIDYIKIKENVVLYTCTQTNIDTVDLTLINLLAIDTLKISLGLYAYFYDLGMTYYIKGFMYEQKEYQPLSILSFLKCTKIDPNRGDAYHNLALIYNCNKQYDLSKDALILYKKYTKKKYWDKNLIKWIEMS